MKHDPGLRVVLNIIWVIWRGYGWPLATSWLPCFLRSRSSASLSRSSRSSSPVQSVKLAGYALWPFGRTLVPAAGRHKGLSAVANVLWFILAGWWLALAHLLAGILLCITIIGIPLGVASFKMAGAALVPVGKTIVRLDELSRPPEDAIVVG